MKTSTSFKKLAASSFNRSGYTLIEIMLVLAIISVLIGAGIFYMSGNLDYAKDTVVQSDLENIGTQLKTYEAENLFLPTTEQGLKALVTQPTTEPVPTHWRQLFEKVPTDPWGMPYQYRNPGKHNPNKFDVFSLGPDRVEDDKSIGNWAQGQ